MGINSIVIGTGRYFMHVARELRAYAESFPHGPIIEGPSLYEFIRDGRYANKESFRKLNAGLAEVGR